MIHSIIQKHDDLFDRYEVQSQPMYQSDDTTFNPQTFQFQVDTVTSWRSICKSLTA